MTDVAQTVAPAPVDRRTTDLLLARLHLRTGSLVLALAEFETLASRGPLDDEALVDLADVRWRTGDLAGAGSAATTALDRGVDAPVAMIIAAESAFALGRPGEARRLATRAMAAAGGTLDALFAGMPRSAVWPPDPAEPAPSAATLFGDDGSDGPDTSGVFEERRHEDRRRSATGPLPATAAGIAAAAVGPTTPGLWDGDTEPEAPVPGPAARSAAMLEAGRQALVAGEPDRAAALLGVAMRVGPHLAPSIVDATMDASTPALLVVRGDALLATGHATEAADAFAAAATGLGVDLPAGAADAEVPSDEVPGRTDAGETTDEPAAPDADAAVPYGPTEDRPQ